MTSPPGPLSGAERGRRRGPAVGPPPGPPPEGGGRPRPPRGGGRAGAAGSPPTGPSPVGALRAAPAGGEDDPEIARRALLRWRLVLGPTGGESGGGGIWGDAEATLAGDGRLGDLDRALDFL